MNNDWHTNIFNGVYASMLINFSLFLLTDFIFLIIFFISLKRDGGRTGMLQFIMSVTYLHNSFLIFLCNLRVAIVQSTSFQSGLFRQQPQ